MKRKKLIFICLAALTLFAGSFLIPSVAGDGSTHIETTLEVMDEFGSPIPNAEIIFTNTYSKQSVKWASTDKDGVAKYIISAGWGRSSGIFYTKHSASINQSNYVVSKNGYTQEVIKFPKTKFVWNEICGVEFGRPKLSLKSTLSTADIANKNLDKTGAASNAK